MLSYIGGGEQANTELPKLLVPVCYGCLHLNASSLSCNHPETINLLWDVFRGFSYRLPSVYMCHRMNGFCKFFYPDDIKSIEYIPKDKDEE